MGPAWTRRDIERIVEILDPVTAEAPYKAFRSLRSVTHTPKGWQMKWIWNKATFKKLVTVRRHNSLSHTPPSSSQTRRESPESKRPKKRRRVEHSTHSSRVAVPGLASDSIDRTKILTLMISHFVTHIQRAKPLTSQAVLDMWTKIATDDAFRDLNVTVDDLIPIYYLKQEVFTPILNSF
ncbi:hypothetical protein DL93DRAFT_2086405 [Clavulina sp. PMI_390]|nr:hypothetical protein DL93DRAFT_2086405 [Clavulina sp. PMI_390]